MTNDQVFEKVREIIVENLGVDSTQVTTDSSFKDDLHADSLDLAELIMDFEDSFSIGDISEEAAMNIKTVGDAVLYIANSLAD